MRRLLPAVGLTLAIAACHSNPVPVPVIATPAAGVAAVDTSPPRGADQPGARALDTLALLPIKGRAPRTGYSRDQFGKGWADLDADGCDTREEVLERDAVDTPIRAGTHHCVVGATVLDPYSGTQLTEPAGPGTTVDIDHVVALGDAWVKGAQALTPNQRLQLANAPINLIPTTAHLNRQKGDADYASWQPPNRGYRCAYAARVVAVKQRYGLWVTTAEHDALAATLTTCPNEPTPTDTP